MYTIKDAEREARAKERKEARDFAKAMGKGKQTKRHVRCKHAVIHTDFKLKGKRK